MLVVGVDQRACAAALSLGAIACPSCPGTLRPWGSARARIIRRGARQEVVQPRRGRCSRCGRTQVLLPASTVLRRRDASTVIAKALLLRSRGCGYRSVARSLQVPLMTARGWLRRWRVVATPLADGLGFERVFGPSWSERRLAVGLLQGAAASALPFAEHVSFVTDGLVLTNTN